MFVLIFWLAILAVKNENSLSTLANQIRDYEKDIFERVFKDSGLQPTSGMKSLFLHCGISQFHGEYDLRSGLKSLCCDKLVALHCLLSGSTDDNLPLDKFFDSSMCNQYIEKPTLCSLHISDKHRVQFQSLVCKNDAHKKDNKDVLDDCCLQHYQSQCFKINFLDECNLTMASQGIDCDQFTKVDAQCGSNPHASCPSPRSLRSNSFFASKFFFFSMIGIFILFGLFYFLCIRLQTNKNSEKVFDNDHNSTRSGSKERVPKSKITTKTNQINRKRKS